MNWVMYTILHRFLRQVMPHHLASKRHKGGAQWPTSLDGLRYTHSPVIRWHVELATSPLARFRYLPQQFASRHRNPLLKYTSNRATLCHRKTAFSGVFCAEGSIRTDRRTLLSGIDYRPDLCPAGAGPTCVRQESWLQGCRRLEGDCLGRQGRSG
jgi:hypothetical protein